jgi:Zn finger protein HypA/HybF involved in hydrogenase expression
MVRCGACRTQFDVPGPGRFACPACGSVNQVRSAPGAPPPPGSAGPAPYSPPPPPPRPDPPSPKISCPECQFTFIVGKIEVASCPNCGTEVETGWAEDDA